jgi:hypothetical protein
MPNEDAVGMVEKSVADGVKLLWEGVGAVLWSKFKYFPSGIEMWGIIQQERNFSSLVP